MKKTIVINFDEEKLSALTMYLEQKGTTLEGELEKTVEGLYHKTVPVGVREFLAMKNGTEKKVEKRKGAVPSAVVCEGDCAEK